MVKRLTIASRHPYGFSLVEVALAVAIASFCLITLMALLPLGLRDYRDANAQSGMVNLATMVGCDLHAAPSSGTSPRLGFSVPSAGGTPSNGTPQTVYVDASGNLTGAVGAAPTAGSIYRVSVYFTPPSTGQRTATLSRILITFPAKADSTPTTNPALYADVFQTVVALNRN